MGQNCVSFVLWVHDWGVLLLLDDGQKKGSSIILQVQYFGYSNSPGGDEGRVHACVLSCFSRVSLFGTLWTVTHQAPLYRRFSRQEYWSGLPCPPPEDLPDPGIKPASFTSPALAVRFFTTSATWETLRIGGEDVL